MGGYELSAELYDLFDEKENVRFFTKAVGEVDTVLDVGAGTGRVAVELARIGKSVVCVEPSPAMRAVLQEKLRQSPALQGRIRLTAGHANGFGLDRTFEAAIMSGVFDHFLDHQQRVESLRNIARHLDDRGILIFDVFLGLMGDSKLEPAGEAEKDGLIIKRLVEGTLLGEGRKLTRLVYETYRGDDLIDRFEERSMVGTTDREGVHRALSAAGLDVVGEWADYDHTPYCEGADLLIVKASRISERYD